MGTFAKDLLQARKVCLARHQTASRTFEIPIGLENPWRSWLMLHEDLKDEIAEATKRGLTDMCAFGATCRKRTDLALWGAQQVFVVTCRYSEFALRRVAAVILARRSTKRWRGNQGRSSKLLVQPRTHLHFAQLSCTCSWHQHVHDFN